MMRTLFAVRLSMLVVAVLSGSSSCEARSVREQATPLNTEVRNTALYKALETRFLKMFGLTEQPLVRADMRVPQYIMDLYNNHIDDEEYETTNIASEGLKTSANTARGFYHKDLPNEEARPSIDETKLRRTKRRVTLDVSSLPSHEEVVKAEWRVYRKNVSAKLNNVARYRINVYQILQPGVTAGGSVKRLLLDSRVVDNNAVKRQSGDEGWDSYDLLAAVQHWREYPTENHGLEVELMSENGNPVDISHLQFDKPQELDGTLWHHHRPLLVVYTKDPETHQHKRRTKRSHMKSPGQKDPPCRRYELNVNFTKLGWSWITAPEVYPAYYCKGVCEFPVTDHMNTTNHAIVQTLVHTKNRNPRKVIPPACCIPTSYESLGIIYFDSSLSPVYKRYKEMIATGCGCR